MKQAHITKIAKELQQRETQVRAVVQLLKEDATVPFIARYRKEATGSLDEITITPFATDCISFRSLISVENPY